MQDFENKDLVDLYYKQTAIINGLWTVYVAATFAAGGFAPIVGSQTNRILVAAALSVAFFAFTAGHWRMLRFELESRLATAAYIRERAETAHASSFFTAVMRTIAASVGEVAVGRLVHFSIDAMVFVAIWIRVFFGPQG